MTKHAVAAFTVAAAFLLSCSASQDQASAVGTSHEAITNGASDTADLGVAALMQADTLICTATLVAPRVLLTAAHCLSDDGAYPEAFFGSTPASGSASGTRVSILAVTRHPAFDAPTLTNDVALALLDGDAPAGATPWPLPATPLQASDVGLALRLVGFGRTSANDATAAEKRSGTATVGALTAQTMALAAAPSQTCSGDSGGPAFATIGGVESIVGVTSSGDPSCAQSASDMRVDAYASSFIAPWLAATAEGGAASGDRCWYPANCATSAGACTAALDDPTLSFCAPACGAGDACPAGLTCLAGSDAQKLCRHATPSPGAAGAACSRAADCASASCVAPASGGSAVCAVTCFQDLPGFCTGNTVCAPVAGADAGAACFAPGASTAATPAKSGGCAVGGGKGESDLGPLVALCVALAASRRRRARAS